MVCGALQFPQAPIIMQTEGMNHVIVFHGRRYITFLECQGEYLREQRIIAAHTGSNCWSMLKGFSYCLLDCTSSHRRAQIVSCSCAVKYVRNMIHD